MSNLGTFIICLVLLALYFMYAIYNVGDFDINMDNLSYNPYATKSHSYYDDLKREVKRKEMRMSKFVCIKDCVSEYKEGSTRYYYKMGETYTYNYDGTMRKPIYYKGAYHGTVYRKFIDENFMSEIKYNKEIDAVDKYFDMFLHSNIRIKKVKKI